MVDRHLADEQWRDIAATYLDRIGLAPRGDDLGVRWVAVRHADDHVHVVATLARQDGRRVFPRNDSYLDRIGLAPRGDDLGVRWVAVRHADDHVHVVATLARQDGRRVFPRNDYYL